MRHLSSRPVLPVALLALAALTGCSSAPAGSPSGPPADDEPGGHGYVEGAEETPEPQLGLLTVDAEGSVALTDLVTEETTGIGAVEGARRVADDGRYLFAQAEGAVSIIDSGRWTVPHGDHFHYYLAPSRVVGELEGELTALATSASRVVISFEGGSASVLDADALGSGELLEVASLEGLGARGVALPLGDALVATGDDGDPVVTVRDSDGREREGESVPCSATGAAIVTNVGAVIGCADGAVLATQGDDGVALESISYPAELAGVPRAEEFRSRINRPTVAALAGDRGFWLLDTRERSWTLHETPTPLVEVTAVDDADEAVVAVDAEGRILVFDGATGEQIAATGAELADSVADPALAEGIRISTDASRSYVVDPAGGRVLEVAFADDARVSREFSTPGLRHAVEVGL